MRRLLGLVLKLALVVAIAIGLAETDGPVSLEWQGWRIDTSTAVLAVAVLGIAALAAILYRLWRGLVTAPRRLRLARAARRRERGYRAVGLGLVAAAVGDGGEAQRQARRAQGLLDEQPLSLMLAAQAAQLGGDTAAARRHFDRMLAHPDTALVGLRGLLTTAIEAGDHAAALGHAERARALAPQAPWLLDALFDLQARAGNWAAAAEVAQASAKRRALPADELARRRALAALGQAETAEAAGQLDEAVRHARTAAQAMPGWVPAVVRQVRLLLVAARHGQAVKLIEQAWPQAPHAELAALYGEAIAQADPLERVMRFERLLARAPDAAEGHLALAEAAATARLWGEARQHFERAAALDPATRARAFAGLAGVEEAERGDREAALRWRTRAAAAPPTPFWLCNRCDQPVRAWSVRCPHCHAVGSLAWHQPVAGQLVEETAPRPGEPIDAVIVDPADDDRRMADQRLAALARAAGSAAGPGER